MAFLNNHRPLENTVYQPNIQPVSVVFNNSTHFRWLPLNMDPMVVATQNEDCWKIYKPIHEHLRTSDGSYSHLLLHITDGACKDHTFVVRLSQTRLIYREKRAMLIIDRCLIDFKFVYICRYFTKYIWSLQRMKGSFQTSRCQQSISRYWM